MTKNPVNIPTERCKHGALLHECRETDCLETWELDQEQTKEVFKDKALARLGKERADDVAEEEEQREPIGKPEQRLFQEFWADRHGGGKTRKRTGLPFDHNTVKAMLHYGAINERQAQIAHHLIDLPRRGVWERIAGELGCSAKTVKREYQRIEKALSRKTRQIYPDGSILFRKSQGKPEYWLTHEIKFRYWADYRRELLLDRSQIRALIKDGRRVIRWPAPKYPDSTLGRLFDALFIEFADCPKPTEWPPEELGHHWKFNTDRCRRSLLKRIGARPWNMKQVYLALGKESKLCRACGTPMLIGLRDVHGQIVTRGKEFCDGTCRVAAHRQARHTLTTDRDCGRAVTPRISPVPSPRRHANSNPSAKAEKISSSRIIEKSAHLKGFDTFYRFVTLVHGNADRGESQHRAESIFKIVGNGNAERGFKLVREAPEKKIDIYGIWRDFSQEKKGVLDEEMANYLGLPD